MSKKAPSKSPRRGGGGKNREYSKEDITAQAAIARIGKVLVPGSAQQDDTSLIVVSLHQAVTSTAGGVINYTLNANPGGYTDWSSFSGTFHEYRILATQITYAPSYNDTYNAALLHNSMIMLFDRIDSTAIASYTLGWNHADSKVGNTGKRMKQTVKMIGIEDAGFVATASPTTVWTHKLYADTVTASTTYGRVFFRALIQFRGRY